MASGAATPCAPGATRLLRLGLARFRAGVALGLLLLAHLLVLLALLRVAHAHAPVGRAGGGVRGGVAAGAAARGGARGAALRERGGRGKGHAGEKGDAVLANVHVLLRGATRRRRCRRCARTIAEAAAAHKQDGRLSETPLLQERLRASA